MPIKQRQPRFLVTWPVCVTVFGALIFILFRVVIYYDTEDLANAVTTPPNELLVHNLLFCIVGAL